jgi:hypothetical protein
MSRRLALWPLDLEETDPALIRRAITRLRDEATAIGPDDPEAWAMLACAADWERDLLDEQPGSDEIRRAS